MASANKNREKSTHAPMQNRLYIFSSVEMFTICDALRYYCEVDIMGHYTKTHSVRHVVSKHSNMFTF